MVSTRETAKHIEGEQMLSAPFQAQLEMAQAIHKQDLENGWGRLRIPGSLDRKYSYADVHWQWVIPPNRGGHYTNEMLVQKAVREAVGKVDLTKRLTFQTFRYFFATQLLQVWYVIRTVQELLGHSDVKTTMVYTHVCNRKVSWRS